jgi:hypothetical protein
VNQHSEQEVRIDDEKKVCVERFRLRFTKRGRGTSEQGREEKIRPLRRDL